MQKKIPQRQCMGCRERKAKRELIRVVRSPEGEVSLDFGGKKNGRGAYICPNPECLKKAIRSKALDRSLEVTIPEEVYQRLEKEMGELEQEREQLEAALCSGTLSIDELTEKSKRLPEVKELIDEKEMRWLELSEIGG